MDKKTQSKLVNYLREFVTEQRWETIIEVLNLRTRYITVVLEDIYQSQNASAVLRSCEGFGIQDVQIIENRHRFNTSKGVTIGADQWLSMNLYREEKSNNTKRCYEKLRGAGYKIVATTPRAENKSIDELRLDRKTALLFGAELTGLSEYALDEADEFVHVPMYGFSESYNISVCAALCLYELSLRLRNSGIDWELSSDEKLDLQLEWLEESIRGSDQIKDKFFEENSK